MIATLSPSRRRALALPVKRGPGLFVATPAHLALWVERTKPAWAKDLSLPVSASVDGILNTRAGIKWPNTLHNALSLLALVRSNNERARKGETLSGYLIGFRENSAAASCQRAKHYARWLKGLLKGEARRC